MSKSHTHIICFWILSLLGLTFAKAQQNKSLDKAYDTAIAQAQEQTANGDFNQAEASYRKAAALKPDAAEASYNLGNLYYNNDKKYNAVENYKKAAEAATTKAEKHKIFHNLGNSFLENKQYDEAVEAYKNALRNDPTDDETRYNLALAKQEKEKNGGGGGGGDDQDQDKDQDSKEGDKDQNSDGKNEGDQKEKEGEDKEGDKGDEKESDKGENSEGENGDGKPKEQDQGKQPQRVEGKLTPQQARQLLEAMSNEEQKIQEKVNAKKAKGKSVKTEKDW